MKKLIKVKLLCECYEGEALEKHYRIVGTSIGFIERPHWKEREFGDVVDEEIKPYS